MKTEIPDFLIEMSERMNTDPASTSHPFWQVRCKEFLPTAEGCNEHHWEIIDDEYGIVYRSDKDVLEDFAEFVRGNYTEYFNSVVSDYDEIDEIAAFVFVFDVGYEDLPDGLRRISMQEVEKVVWTGLTQAGAEQFIERQQHNYPKLYTYVESAYWSPEFRQLQDWIKSLTK